MAFGLAPMCAAPARRARLTTAAAFAATSPHARKMASSRSARSCSATAARERKGTARAARDAASSLVAAARRAGAAPARGGGFNARRIASSSASSPARRRAADVSEPEEPEETGEEDRGRAAGGPSTSRAPRASVRSSLERSFERAFFFSERSFFFERSFRSSFALERSFFARFASFPAFARSSPEGAPGPAAARCFAIARATAASPPWSFISGIGASGSRRARFLPIARRAARIRRARETTRRAAPWGVPLERARATDDGMARRRGERASARRRRNQ